MSAKPLRDTALEIARTLTTTYKLNTADEQHIASMIEAALLSERDAGELGKAREFAEGKARGVHSERMRLKRLALGVFARPKKGRRQR